MQAPGPFWHGACILHAAMRWAAFMLVFLSFPARAGWEYDPAGRFAERGRCTSAAMAAGELVASCASGIWRGRPAALRRVAACPAGSSGGHARALAPGRFAATTRCGLFLLEPDGSVVRVPVPGEPQALAVDGAGDLLIVAAGALFRYRPGGATPVSLGPWPDPAPPWSLAWSDRGAVGQGLRVVAFGRRPARIRPPSPGARGVVQAPGVLLWVGPRGGLWTQSLSASGPDGPRAAGRLDHRSASVKDLGGGRVWAAGKDRWDLIGSGTRLQGWLPAGWGELLAVRDDARSGPPWLVGRGVVLRPVFGPDRPARTCREPSIGLPAGGRPMRPDPALAPVAAWAWLLPDVTLRVFGGQDGGLSRADRILDRQLARGSGLELILSWPLGSGWLVARDSELEQIRAEAAGLERARLEAVERLVSEGVRLCGTPAGSRADLRLEALRFELQALEDAHLVPP